MEAFVNAPYIGSTLVFGTELILPLHRPYLHCSKLLWSQCQGTHVILHLSVCCDVHLGEQVSVCTCVRMSLHYQRKQTLRYIPISAAQKASVLESWPQRCLWYKEMRWDRKLTIMTILNTVETNDVIFEPERNYWWFACCQETKATELFLSGKHTHTHGQCK